MWPRPTHIQAKTASILDVNSTNRFITYFLPKIHDPNINDTSYDVSVLGLKHWISFDKTKGKEFIKID